MRYAISRRALALAVAGGALLFCAGTASAQQTAAATPDQVDPKQVVIDNFTFAPATLTVAAGSRVVWINHDEEPHTVLSVDGGLTFKSPALDTDDKFAFVFAAPGTYKYFCSIHPHMVGTIIVK